MSDLQGKLLKVGTGFRLVLSFNLLLQMSCWDETGDVNRFSHSQFVLAFGTLDVLREGVVFFPGL